MQLELFVLKTSFSFQQDIKLKEPMDQCCHVIKYYCANATGFNVCLHNSHIKDNYDKEGVDF